MPWAIRVRSTGKYLEFDGNLVTFITENEAKIFIRHRNAFTYHGDVPRKADGELMPEEICQMNMMRIKTGQTPRRV